MPAVTRKGVDKTNGHGCFPPTIFNSASPNVFVNGIAVVRQSDSIVVHCCGPSCHAGTLSKGSSTVFVNGLQICRIGDPVSCGDTVAEGSSNVFAGG